MGKRSGALSTSDDDIGMGHNGPPPIDDAEMERLSKLDMKGLLEEGRKAIVMTLLMKVKTGIASAAEMAVLRNLLRDNGLIMGFDGDEGGSGEVARTEAIGF